MLITANVKRPQLHKKNCWINFRGEGQHGNRTLLWKGMKVFEFSIEKGSDGDFAEAKNHNMDYHVLLDKGQLCFNKPFLQ